MNTLRPKSILKYRPEISSSSSISATTTATTGSSWLSRIQSKLYSTHANYNDQDNEEYKRSLTLPKQDLRRVTFSVGNLTTEFPFFSDESPRDEEYEREKQAAAALIAARKSCTSSRNLENIEVLDLSNHYEHACILREEGTIDRFRNTLRTSRKSLLNTIDLSQQPIAPNQAGPISDIFILNFGLNRLNLSNCKLNDEAVRILLCSLLASNTIQHLNLSQNNFKFKGYKYIAIFMKESKSIQSLNISLNTIERRGIEYIAQGVKLATTLKKLIFDNCTIKPMPSSSISPTMIEIFSNGINQSKSLKSLSICNNHLFNTANPNTNTTWMNNLLLHLDGGVAGGGLEELDLSENNMELWMPSLAIALRNSNSLIHLVLSNCKISPEGLSILSDALAENSCLESLDLSNNLLSHESDEGILALKAALARNSSLTSLNLSNTQLDSSAAIALAEALPENTSLARLDLSKNPNIEMAGILALSVSIKMNHTLTFLDINIPPMDEELANLQNDIVAVCTTNMLQKVEAQKKLEEQHSLLEQQHSLLEQQQEKEEEEAEEITTLSPSSSSSSSNSSTLDTAVVELPSNDILMNARKVLDGSTSPQLSLDDDVTKTAAPSSNNSTTIPSDASSNLNNTSTTTTA